MKSTRPLPILLLLIALAAPAGAASRPDALAAAASRYTGWFLAGRTDSLLAHFSPEMAARVRGHEGLTAFRADVMKTLGDSVVVGEIARDTLGGRTLHRQILRGPVSGVEAGISWSLDSLGAVIGFSVRPKAAKEAPSKYLAYESKTPLRLPFEGEWTVFAGGRTPDQNHHAGARNQRFALDLAIAKEGTTHGGDGSRLDQYHCWGAKVLAPAAGTVVAVADTFPDNPMGTTDRTNAAGNFVTIDHGNGEFSFLAHFQRRSLLVKPGDKVAGGQPLGLAGNSGNTSEPHLHYHLQDGPAFPSVECMPAAFHEYVADDLPVSRGEPLKWQRIRAR